MFFCEFSFLIHGSIWEWMVGVVDVAIARDVEVLLGFGELEGLDLGDLGWIP